MKKKYIKMNQRDIPAEARLNNFEKIVNSGAKILNLVSFIINLKIVGLFCSIVKIYKL